MSTLKKNSTYGDLKIFISITIFLAERMSKQVKELTTMSEKR